MGTALHLTSSTDQPLLIFTTGVTTSIRKFFRTWTHQGALSILGANSLATPPPQGPLPCPPRPWRPQWAASRPRPPRIPSAANLGQKFLLRDWDIRILWYNIYNLCMHIYVICMCPDDFNGPANNSWFPAHWLFCHLLTICNSSTTFRKPGPTIRNLDTNATADTAMAQNRCLKDLNVVPLPTSHPFSGPKQLTTSRTHNAAFLIILHAPVVF